MATALLLLHMALAIATVGAATHLALWLRGHRRGVPTRHAAAQRFARWLAILYTLAMVVGLWIYPQYRIRVRAEYLDQPSAVVADHRGRAERQAEAEAQHGVPSVTAPAADVDKRAGKVARWFDVKEHWIAVGWFVACILAFVLTRTPAAAFRADSRLGGAVFWLAVGVAAVTWAGAAIGSITSATRAI